MKLRSLFALCTLLLGSAVYAAPATQATPAGDLSFLAPAATTPAPAATTPGCQAPALPFLTPAPTDRTDICGSCSQSRACVGHTVGGQCSSAGGRCFDGGSVCSSGGLNCYCGVA
jgi:hypothetical protein